MVLEKAPPSAVEAERAILGSLMVNPGQLDFALEIVSPADFFMLENRLIFEAIIRTAPDTDWVTVSEKLESAGMLAEIGGMGAIQGIIENTPDGLNVGRYARIVKSKAQARSIIKIAQDLELAGYSDDWKPALDTAMSQLLDVNGVEQKWEHGIKDSLRNAVDHIEMLMEKKGLSGISTGLDSLDTKLGGYHDSDLIVVGGRPAMGKTAFLLSTMMACEGAIGLISSEQPNAQIAQRLIASTGRVSGESLRNPQEMQPDDWSRVTSAMSRLEGREVRIYDKPYVTISDLSRQARAWKRRFDIKALYVDYIQNLKPDNKTASKTEGFGEIVKGLKQLARELQIPVIALSQVNRNVEQRTDKRPSMSDLYHSSEIEMEADQILLLYRDEVYNENTQDLGIAEIHISKNRHGGIGKTRVAYQGPYMRFENLAEIYSEEGY